MFANTDNQQFEMNATIEMLMYPQRFAGQKATKRDIQETAKNLIQQIEQHPSFKVHDLIKNPLDPEEGRRTFRARLYIQQGFSGGFSEDASMLLAYNELIRINRDLHQIAGEFFIIATRKSLGKKLIRSFNALRDIDKRFNRVQLIEKFTKCMQHEKS